MAAGAVAQLQQAHSHSSAGAGGPAQAGPQALGQQVSALGIAQPGVLQQQLHRQITGAPDTVRRLLADLCRAPSSQDVSGLRKHVEEEARDLGGEIFARFMENLYESIQNLVASEDMQENLGAVRAIDELIDVRLGENSTKISRFAIYLREIFETKRDFETLSVASVALGRLAREGGSFTADLVEFQVKRALSWLTADRVECRRFAAVLILKEMAENAPTVFNIHVSEFVEQIWFALRDPNLVIRERAVEALRACLCVIEKRETRWRVQWYYRMFESTQEGLQKISVESIHGSLLAVGELLRNTGEFMMSRYKEVANIVFKYREHRDKLVRRSITALLPRIAEFLRDRFVNSYLKICMDHLLAVMRNPTERASGFAALGEMATSVGPEIKSYLPVITSLLRDAIAPRRGKPCSSAIACVGCLAEALKSDMEEHVRVLLDPMFAGGLTPTLVESLTKIASSSDSLLPKIQEKLLETISYVLIRSPYRPTKGAVVRSASSPSLQPPADISSTALIQLALQTLTEFNLKGHELLEFARDAVVGFLEHEDPVTRREAAVCCCRLVEHSVSTAGTSASASRLWASQSGRGTAVGLKRRRLLIEEILEKLLVTSVADSDAGVRKAIFESLSLNGSFEDFLAQADSLRALFIALNDESYEVRELAISMSGRLAEKNPAYVLPALRRHLLQLLRDLEQSAESKSREESAKLLGCLIKACERLMSPYIAPVLKTLILKLGDGSAGSGNSGVITGVLATIGDLARVGGLAIVPDLPRLMDLIVEALLDGASVSKREVAVSTLGQIVESTGYVITPYTDHPALLGLLLRLLNGELAWSTRREVLKVLGIIGALDPHIHKRNLRKLQSSHTEGARGTGTEAGTLIRSVEELPIELWQSGGLFTTSEDYYPTVAINALIRILRDSSLSSYHPQVVRSLMYIFKAMGLASVPYLPKIMPDLFQTARGCEDGLREYIFWQLANLISIVRQHIRKYLDDVLLLISDYWSTMILPANSRPNSASPVLNLVEQLCLALNDEFRVHLPELLPRCVQLLTEAERIGDYTCVPQVLHTFEVFGGCLDEHMHLVLPALVRLFGPDLSDAPTEIRQASLRTLSRLLPTMQVSGHVSNLLHPLMRTLDGSADELRKDSVDTLCALAVALGSDFSIFVPAVKKLLQKHHIQHPQFEEVEQRLRRRQPLVIDLHLSPVTPPIGSGDVLSVAGNSFHGLDAESERYDLDGLDALGSFRSLKVNEGHLRTVWETSKRSTKEDWLEWMRHFSVELLKESPSPALRTCAVLAQVQPFMARELFAAGFVSCWGQLNELNQDQLVRSLNNAFMSAHIPPEILATLLNLAEFMEHDEKDLPIDIRTLGALAEKCHAYAKALHYKEMEFAGLPSLSKDAQPGVVVEALIHINNQLNQHEAAVGILTYAQQKLSVGLKESWYEKLQRWEEALEAYEKKASQVDNPHDFLECTLGQMRCLAALAQWGKLSELCGKLWARAEASARRQIAPMAASAAWNMGKWEEMGEYVKPLGDEDEVNSRMSLQTISHTATSGSSGSDGAFFRAVLHVRHGEYVEARNFIEKARKSLATEVAALVLESYDRAYSNMVRVQQLVELEEVIDYHMLKDDNESRKALARKMWADRIRGTKRKVEVWQALLAVRTLVLPPEEDIGTHLKFASLCRKSGRFGQSRATLVKLLKYDPELSNEEGQLVTRVPEVMLAYYKYQWSLGDESKKWEAFNRLQMLCSDLSDPAQASNPALTFQYGNTHNGKASLLSRIHLKLGAWQWALSPGLDDNAIKDILSKFKSATENSRTWSKAWHKWAYFNTEVMNRYNKRGDRGLATRHLVAAVTGYFKSIANSSSSEDSLQDILRLLTLWFTHGETKEVQGALKEGLQLVNIDTWLAVLPQIIARIHSNNPTVRDLIQSLLINIGHTHPQALMYPLLVACKSISSTRQKAAEAVVERVKQERGVLVDQAQLVSKELIRVAILWHEMWHEALEEASRLYFGDHNVDGMLNVLAPLHAILNNEGPVTAKEESFVQDYGHELQEANECCNKFRRTGKDAELTQAWDLYYHVFRRINKQLASLTTLELQHVSPSLVAARDLELAVPGTYRTGIEPVKIREFSPQLVVIASKQRPRKCTIHGDDGVEYVFLLKGHEDLRQDERVMQLFGLVNTLLGNARSTAEKDLSIQRYAVIPLSPNSGLIGWVPNCDTLHHLIREYRDARKILVNVEHRLMIAFAQDYEHLTLMAKVEVFEHALDNTVGDDLAKVLWLKSRSSEVWLDRRTNYTRSLAVMSMVGYLLGLGDRHPSNLMLDRFSGKILHIDFGDCFEASMNREKFPERVPFRLTRMLVKAMEVSGIEGNFRSTCENVMQVLRGERDSVMAMMEAFVHDPLINWRLFNLTDAPHAATTSMRPQTGDGDEAVQLPSPPQRGVRERELREAVGQLGDANEVLYERAVQVMDRMKHKLTGRDFTISSVGAPVVPAGSGANGPISAPTGVDTRDVEPGLSVQVQVQKLISQATSHENLCQSYVGWCPFW